MGRRTAQQSPSPSDVGLPELARAETVAEWIGVSRGDVYQMVHTGKIPGDCFFRIGRRLRFDVERLRSWLAKTRGAALPKEAP